MKSLVISQPMYFPWIGIFEQMRLVKDFVHYDDVQLPQGRSFCTRVQMKTPQGMQWLSVPVVRKSGQLIKDAKIDDSQGWRAKHLVSLAQNYAKAPYKSDMLKIAEQVLKQPTDGLSDLNILSIETCAKYFGLNTRFSKSSETPTTSSSSEKLLQLALKESASVYITGHGAKNYLDHQLFDDNSVEVRYMDYKCTPYPQQHGPFDPHVTILDLIANCGQSGINYIHSETKNWKQFIYE